MDKREAVIIICIVTCINIILLSISWLVLDAVEATKDQKEIMTERTIESVSEEEPDTIAEPETEDDVPAIENEIVAFTLSEDEFLGDLDYDGTSRIRGALEGQSFYVNNIMVFNFMSGGLYSGFFDNNNISVNGYSYEVTMYYDKYLLNIYNTDRTQAVSYVLSIDSTNNLYIYYEGADATMKLKRI